MKSDEIASLVEQIKPLLAGRDPSVQSAVLADLVSIWLAGNISFKNKTLTDTMRRSLLKAWVRIVTELVPVNAKLMGLPW